MNYEWLLFDADGTLFDYTLAEEKALRGAFQEFDIPFSTPYLETYQRINRQVWIDFENRLISATALRTRRFDLLFDDLGVMTDSGDFSASYLRHLAQGTDLVAGAEELVRRLVSQFHLGLITNGLQDVQRSRLENSKIAGMFDVVTISEEIGAAKPDPAFFDTVFQKMGQPTRKSVLVIGDSLTSDIQGGNMYGLATCWYNPFHSPADPRFPASYEIHNLPDLLNIVGDR
jgi:2-haloacid dehalogenase